MKVYSIIILLLAAAASTASGDVVYMLDGSTREGLIESHNAQELHLRVDRDGIAGTLTIPMAQISRAVINRRGTPAPKPTTALQPSFEPLTPDLQPVGPDLFEGATAGDYIAFRNHGTLEEFARAVAGKGLDDANRLPPAARLLWNRAVHSEIAGRNVDTLGYLRDLEAGMRALPEGIRRLDAIARRERGEGFGTWMGRTHWALIDGKYASGQFDLSDVRDIERPALVGFFKEKMGPALEPLRTYFPPLDEKTGQYGPFRTAQLQSITVSNAIEVKEKAVLAAAVLLAQIKLEPAMPAVDKGMLYNELVIVNRIRSRSQDMESLAKAAVIRAEQDRRAAEEKARRDAAAAAQRARTPPK